jgi:hypothetical protein
MPPSSSSSPSSDRKSDIPLSSRFIWPFSLQSSKRIDEFRLSDENEKSASEERGTSTATSLSRIVWLLSFSKFKELDEFRVSGVHSNNSSSKLMPPPVGKGSYGLTWPFSTEDFSTIDNFRVPTDDTTTLDPDLQLNETALGSLREAISSGLVRSEFDRKEFLPEKTFRLLFDRSSIHACLPTATKGLVDFVNEKGRRVFATVLLCTDLDGAGLLSLLENFHRQQFCDSHLPIARQCPPECDNQKRGHLHTLSHVKFSGFHHPFWRTYMISRFYHGQWAFLSPTFLNNIVMDRLYPDTVLPFTSLNDAAQEGYFSTVYQATMPIEHQDVVLNVRG